jgi:membrane-associated phospholipid phosphatase
MRWLVGVFIAASISAAPASAQTGDPNTDQPAAAQPEVNKDSAPQHPHTGWSTLFKDSVHDFVAFPQRKSTWVLLWIGGTAALATHPADEYVHTHVVGNTTTSRVFALGKWVGSSEVQVGTAVGLWAVGRYVVAPVAGESRTNKYSEVGFDLIRAQILSKALVSGMKSSVRRNRPTGECCAFPSGHATTAFAAASVLERHFGYRASWPALAGAMYVAVSRLVDNRHFLSDVMFGAGLGTASGWTVVGTRGRNRYTVQPVPVSGGMMITLMRVEPEM